MANQTKNLSPVAKRVIAKDCLRLAICELEKADSILFGLDKEMIIFPKIHTSNAYAALALEALEDLDPITITA